MKRKGLAFAACVAALSSAASAGSAPHDSGTLVSLKPVAVMYIDGIGFTDTFAVGAGTRVKGGSRFAASGFSTAQNVDFSSRTLGSEGPSITETVLALPASDVQYSTARPIVETTVSKAPESPKSAANAETAIAGEAYAPVLAGLGVLGFLAMRRKNH